MPVRRKDIMRGNLNKLYCCRILFFLFLPYLTFFFSSGFAGRSRPALRQRSIEGTGAEAWDNFRQRFVTRSDSD